MRAVSVEAFGGNSAIWPRAQRGISLWRADGLTYGVCVFLALTYETATLVTSRFLCVQALAGASASSDSTQRYVRMSAHPRRNQHDVLPDNESLLSLKRGRTAPGVWEGVALALTECLWLADPLKKRVRLHVPVQSHDARRYGKRALVSTADSAVAREMRSFPQICAPSMIASRMLHSCPCCCSL